MNNSNWGMDNLYGPRMKTPIINGRSGAEMFRIGPESNAILLDASGGMIWIVSTDSAGAKTIQPYDITPHVDPEPPDYNLLLARLNKMEELLSGLVSTANNTRANAGFDAANSTATTTEQSYDITKQF